MWSLTVAQSVLLTSPERSFRFPIPDGVAPEALGPALVQALRDADPAPVVLAPNLPVERCLAGAIAAAFDAPVLTGVREISGERVSLERFGGIVREVVELDGPAVLIGQVPEPAGLGDEPTDVSAASAAVVPAPHYEARVTGETPAPSGTSNLSAAARLVVAGRGFAAQEDLALGERLAGALGAEFGCTRPLAEGLNWMDKSRYVGVSGQQVAPELYVAVGTSGQIHHLSGVDAATVVAICDDEAAPIFAAADYGIVGDLYQVLPELIRELGGD